MLPPETGLLDQFQQLSSLLPAGVGERPPGTQGIVYWSTSWVCAACQYFEFVAEGPCGAEPEGMVLPCHLSTTYCCFRLKEDDGEAYISMPCRLIPTGGSGIQCSNPNN